MNARHQSKRWMLKLGLMVGLISIAAAKTRAGTPPEPVVAVHVSEFTQALETMPAQPPTPTGPGTTGQQWFRPEWHYFVAAESLKEALRSDGTPFVEVSDADIVGGALQQPDGSPRYPIVFSLAAEAVADTEISPLRDYVSAGGCLFVGSSAFTRDTNGSPRGDFALADEMGLHTAQPGLANWVTNTSFTRLGNHGLVSHVPAGNLVWRMPFAADQVPLGISPSNALHGAHLIWHISVSNAQTLATGDAGPLLTVNPYGHGEFIYHSALQPLIGHGGFDAGMYSYLIYRHAIERAFATARLPLLRVSPWRYQHNAAFIVRHDCENYAWFLRQIEASAAYEKSVGAKGEYYFCTGTLRVEMADSNSVIASLRRAVVNSGALFGPHNGGLKNPNYPSLPLADYAYWHWGPDEAYDITPPGYASGLAYARTSVSNAFADIDGWFSGLNHASRVWASPAFNSTREASYAMMEQLGAVSMGEQKVGPFPHWTLSTQTEGKRYPHTTMPLSEWFNAGEMVQALDDHTTNTMRAAVDFYYDRGLFINFYSHSPTEAANVPGDYARYTGAKPAIWAANSAEIHDWWLVRSNVSLAPTFSTSGVTSILQTAISGALDTNTAVELTLPNASGLKAAQVFLNGAPATAGSSRLFNGVLKIKVGTGITNLEVRYPDASTDAVSLWADWERPVVFTDPDVNSAEFGLKFQSAADGFITGIRFYKSSSNTGTHTGHLWTAGGTALASVTFSNETASGWQQQALAAPVGIHSNTTYVVSYHAPNGHPSLDDGYFSTGGFTNAPLRAPASSGGGNGVFRFGPSAFPNTSAEGANFWVDAVYVASTNLPPAPHIESLELTNGVATITWTAVSNGVYRLQFLNDLVTTNWLDVTPDVTASGPAANATNVTGNQPVRLYRVKVVR